MNRSHPKVSVLCFILIFFAALLSACAPPAGMAATLTMLPGTFTPVRTAVPSRTPYPTNTIARVKGWELPTSETADASGTATPPGIIEVQQPAQTVCVATPFDTTIPPDPSLMIGMHYNQNRLPAALKLVDSGPIAGVDARWTLVTWQGRRVYWIEKPTCQDTAGKPYWEISAVKALPVLDELSGETAVDACYTNDKITPNVIGFGVYDIEAPAAPVIGGQTGWKVRVQQLWQIQDQFTALDAQGLTCIRKAQ